MRARRSRTTLVGVALGVAGMLAAGCSSGSGESGGGATQTTAAQTTAAAGGGDEVKLTAQNTSWDTTSLQLKSGAKVTVEVANKDNVEHNFTFTAASAVKDIEGGEDASISFTAPAAGSYKFFCKYHQSAMTGTVMVT
jgi:plastocyanin